MKCKRCGEQIDDDSIYCELCGAKQSDDRKIKWWMIVAIAGIMIVGLVLGILLSPHHTTDTAPVPDAPIPQTEDFTGMDMYPMIWVEGGSFIMGDSAQNAKDEDCPPHWVELDGYWIGQYEVSRGLWREIMGNDPSMCEQKPDGTPLTREERELLPVENVGYDEIQEFIVKLNQKTGGNFALPSEAQWEYAARGGVKSEGHRFANGQDTPGDIRSDGKRAPSRTISSSTRPNELGIYHMSGNVAEWCRDYYSASFYYKAVGRNPVNEVNGNEDEMELFVVRGGSFDDMNPEYVNVYHRDAEDSPQAYIGFRLIKTN